MSEPDFITVEQVLEIHHFEVSCTGGALGVRSPETLESAVGAPQSGFGDFYFHSDLFEMAAAYLYHITENHPFVDGNKRTAAHVAMAFLELNGSPVDVASPDLEKLVLGVARGHVDKPAVADFFRAAVVQAEPQWEW